MSNTIYQPYTYLIGWSNLDRWYYGCQYNKKSNPNNLWVTYFTSSKIVEQFRKQHGEPDIIEVRMIFKTKEQTLRCEKKILLKLNVTKNIRWLNQHIDNIKFFNSGHTQQAKNKMSLARKGKIPWNKGISHSTETRIKIRNALIGKHKSNIGKKIWNNGKIEKFSFKCPGAEFTKGRLPFSQSHREKIGKKSKARKYKPWSKERRSKLIFYSNKLHNNFKGKKILFKNIKYPSIANFLRNTGYTKIQLKSLDITFL